MLRTSLELVGVEGQSEGAAWSDRVAGPGCYCPDDIIGRVRR